MTTVFRMPDGTHVRVNDSDRDSLPDDWELVGPAADQAEPQFVGLAEARGEDEPKPEPPKVEEKPKAKAKAKVVEGPKEK